MSKQSVEAKTGIEVVWPGKYDAKGVRSQIEVPSSLRFGEEWFGSGENILCCGDNLLVLQDLVSEAKESIDLVYIDPPFNTGSNFSAKLRRGKESSSTEVVVPAYEDNWEGGAAGFLQMLDARLRLIHKMLSPSGSLYVHVDPTVGHAVKILLDEIFGSQCFQREIVWRIGWLSGYKTQAKNWIRNHDLIYFYVKNPQNFTFNKEFAPYPPGYLRRDGKPPKGRGIPIEDVWNANMSEFSLSGKDSLDSIQIKSFSREKTGWATQKNESLLARIVRASSNPGDLVADFFCGSGTTAVVASRLGRRWIASDISPVAVNLTLRRVLQSPGVSSLLKYEVQRQYGAKRRSTQAGSSVRSRKTSSDAVLSQDQDSGFKTARDKVVLQYGAVSSWHPYFHGKRGESAVFVALPGESIDARKIQEIIKAARASNLKSLELIAWHWKDDWDWATLYREAGSLKFRLVQARSRVNGLADIRQTSIEFFERFLPKIKYNFDRHSSFSIQLEECIWNHSCSDGDQFHSLCWRDRIDSWVVMASDAGKWRVIWDSHCQNDSSKLVSESSEIAFGANLRRTSVIRVRVTDILGVTVSEEPRLTGVVTKRVKSSLKSKKSEREKRITVGTNIK